LRLGLAPALDEEAGGHEPWVCARPRRGASSSSASAGGKRRFGIALTIGAPEREALA
jgi:hypothetical protein